MCMPVASDSVAFGWKIDAAISYNFKYYKNNI